MYLSRASKQRSVIIFRSSFFFIKTRNIPMNNQNQSSKGDIDSSRFTNEQQSLQLCAVHTINNLLQHRQTSQSRPATKEEFDEIADKLALHEKSLFSTFDGQEQTQAQQKLFLYDKLTSSHRTMFLGNYSLDVMETALKNRDVILERVKIAQNKDLSTNPEINAIEKLLRSFHEKDGFIGFIVNTKVRRLQKVPLLRHIPLPKSYRYSRHWMCILPSQQKNEWVTLDSMESELLEIKNMKTVMISDDDSENVIYDGGLYRYCLDLIHDSDAILFCAYSSNTNLSEVYK